MRAKKINSDNAFSIKEVVSKMISPLSSSPNLLKDYEKNRKISQKLLSKEMISCLSKDAITTCGKKLRILQGKTLMLNREGELDIIMDYCLFHHYSGDKNAVDRYALTKGDKLSGDEKAFLSVMQQAEYAFLIVEKTLSHGGVLVKNFFNGRQELLIDKGISSSAIPNLGLISTIVRFPDYIMTTGAAIPVNKVGKSIFSVIKNYAQKYENFNTMPKAERSSFVASLVRICLREDAAENITYM